MFLIRVWTQADELPDDIKNVEWSKEDWEYIVLPNSMEPKDVEFVEKVAKNLSLGNAIQYSTNTGLVFFVVYSIVVELSPVEKKSSDELAVDDKVIPLSGNFKFKPGVIIDIDNGSITVKFEDDQRGLYFKNELIRDNS